MTASATLRALALAATTAASAAVPTWAQETALKIAYAGDVMGLKVLEASLDAQIGPDEYAAQSRFESAGVAEIFQETRVEAQTSGARGADALTPGAYSHLEITGEKQRSVVIRHGGGDVSVTIAPMFGSLGEPPADDAAKAEALDPLSALVALAVSDAGACAGAIPVFDGKRRYDLALSPAGAEAVDTAAFSGEAIRCGLRYVPVSGFDAEDLVDMSIYETVADLWLAPVADGVAAPIRLSAALPGPMGADVTINLAAVSMEHSTQ